MDHLANRQEGSGDCYDQQHRKYKGDSVYGSNSSKQFDVTCSQSPENVEKEHERKCESETFEAN